MNWGKSIVLVIALFMGFITFLVTKMVGQKVDLVQDGYYKSDQEYEKQQLKERNYLTWSEQISTKQSADQLEILFPIQKKDRVSSGTVVLFRPADKRADKQYQLKLNAEGKQIVSTNGLAKGLWKLKLDWKEGDNGFYMEKELILN